MPQRQRRHSLKSKDAKLILNEVSARLKVNVEALFGSKVNVEAVEVNFGQIYLIGRKALFFKVRGRVLPTLLFHDFAARAPQVVVDMGAVPYVCKGADVMAPGIVRIEGEFGKGDLVLVVDEKYGKALALGESLYDSKTARSTKQGAVVKNFHFVSDKIWNFAKTLAE
jgi:PUA-domain protein